MTPNPSPYRVRRDHRAEQDAADRPWWRRIPAVGWLVGVLGPTALLMIVALVIVGVLFVWLGGVR